jgi:sulfane dehydrogenase subunit SoxC
MGRNDRTKRTAIGRSVSEPPAASGRRTFLARSAGIVGAAAAGFNARVVQAADEVLPALPKWMRSPGTPMRGYGQPSKFEEPVKRFVAQPYGAIAPGVGPSFTPLESLNGTITPSGLHFERHHNGVPDSTAPLHPAACTSSAITMECPISTGPSIG